MMTRSTLRTARLAALVAAAIVPSSSNAGRAAELKETTSGHTRPGYRTQPLIRGTLWWLAPSSTEWSRERWECEIQAQRDIGFDILWLFNVPALLAKIEKDSEASSDAAWWGQTMRQTGIDILMLQDSGEHFSFFTLAQREPFFAALADACHRAGAQFWVNVETGEIELTGWDDYLARVGGWGDYLTVTSFNGKNKAPWRFTPIDWLEQKLDLAARYGDGIINWGYFPFMDPLTPPTDPAATDNTRTTPLEAYRAYKAYYQRVKR